MKKKDVRGDPYVFYKKVGDSAESLSLIMIQACLDFFLGKCYRRALRISFDFIKGFKLRKKGKPLRIKKM